MKKAKVGVIGCGRISPQYLDNLVHRFQFCLEVIACADAIRNGRPMRANGALMYHVHDVMHAIHEASQQGSHVIVQSRIDRPEPFPAGFKPNIFAQE